MNERIRALADKIWEEKYWTDPNTDKLLPAQLNRFAELIVRQCAEICLEANDHKNILRHFGLLDTAKSQRPGPLDSSYPDGDGYWK